jgi:hypothetical protein
MYLTIRRYENVDRRYAEQSVKRNRETLVPLLRQQPGFIAYYTLEAEDGVVVSIAVYETKEAAEESNRIAAEWTRQNSSQFVPNPPQITAGEVVANA